MGEAAAWPARQGPLQGPLRGVLQVRLCVTLGRWASPRNWARGVFITHPGTEAIQTRADGAFECEGKRGVPAHLITPLPGPEPVTARLPFLRKEAP